MNFRSLFGALVFFPSILCADSIVQNFSFSAHELSEGSMGSMGSAFNYDGFSETGATLTSVSFSLSAHIAESCMDNNLYAQIPVELISYINGFASVSFSGGGLGISVPSTHVESASQLVAPGANYGMSADVYLNGNWSSSDPAAFSFFQQSGFFSTRYMVVAQSWAGWNLLDGTMDFALTYNYTAPDTGVQTSPEHGSGTSSVPEGGLTLAMLAAGVIALRFARCRF